MPSEINIRNVEILTEKLSKAKAIYFTDYLGLNVGEITNLRRNFFLSGIEYCVAKNSLLKLAIENNDFKVSDEIFDGSTAIAFSYEESITPAKVIKRFTKDHDLPLVKGILFEGDYLPKEEFQTLAEMLSRDELLAKFTMMLSSPLQKFASTLNGQMLKVIGLLNSIKDEKS